MKTSCVKSSVEWMDGRHDSGCSVDVSRVETAGREKGGEDRDVEEKVSGCQVPQWEHYRGRKSGKNSNAFAFQ